MSTPKHRSPIEDYPEILNESDAPNAYMIHSLECQFVKAMKPLNLLARQFEKEIKPLKLF